MMMSEEIFEEKEKIIKLLQDMPHLDWWSVEIHWKVTFYIYKKYIQIIRI
jgi:hypothetical protein